MNNQKETAGKTAWKPEYQGRTMVIFRDQHSAHNIYHHNLTEEDFDWMSRYCKHHGFLFTIRRKEVVA